MPIGCVTLIPHIGIDLIVRRPRSVLDLGIGHGLYGAVVRNYCGDLDPGTYRHTRLIGVEGFAVYRGPLWELYDQVFVADIEHYLTASDETWDLILLLDVLEHFDRPDGQQLLANLANRLNRDGCLWVGTPAVWMPQDDAYGNEYERHRSLWTRSELQALGFEMILDGTLDHHGTQMLLARMCK